MAYAMTSTFEQSQLLCFEKNFIRAAQQTDSKLLKTPAIQHMDIKGITNLSTIDSTELEEITDEGSNPDKVYEEITTQNRRSVQRRFTKTYLVDNYDKCVNLITDPTSDIFQNLKEAFNRATDRCIASAATADVYIGSPNEAAATLTAADDGVVTIAGTTAFDYETVISPAITQFENNYIDCAQGVTLAISANEKESLRNDDKYMNAFYSSANKIVSILEEIENTPDEKTKLKLMKKNNILEDVLSASENQIKFHDAREREDLYLNAYYIMKNQEIPESYIDTTAKSQQAYSDLKKLHDKKKEKAQEEYFYSDTGIN